MYVRIYTANVYVHVENGHFAHANGMPTTAPASAAKANERTRHACVTDTHKVLLVHSKQACARAHTETTRSIAQICEDA